MSSLAIFYSCEAAFLFVALLVAGIIDVRTSKIPNLLIIIMLVVWVVVRIFDFVLHSGGLSDPNANDALSRLVKYLLDVAAVILVFGCLFVVFYKVGNFDRDKLYFGMGDVKLIIVLCLYIGLKNLIFVLAGSCIFFLIYVFVRHLVTNNKSNRAPFAPSFFMGYVVWVVWYLISMGY